MSAAGLLLSLSGRFPYRDNDAADRLSARIPQRLDSFPNKGSEDRRSQLRQNDVLERLMLRLSAAVRSSCVPNARLLATRKSVQGWYTQTG